MKCNELGSCRHGSKRPSIDHGATFCCFSLCADYALYMRRVRAAKEIIPREGAKRVNDHLVKSNSEASTPTICIVPLQSFSGEILVCSKTEPLHGAAAWTPHHPPTTSRCDVMQAGFSLPLLFAVGGLLLCWSSLSLRLWLFNFSTLRFADALGNQSPKFQMFCAVLLPCKLSLLQVWIEIIQPTKENNQKKRQTPINIFGETTLPPHGVAAVLRRKRCKPLIKIECIRWYADMPSSSRRCDCSPKRPEVQPLSIQTQFLWGCCIASKYGDCHPKAQKIQPFSVNLNFRMPGISPKTSASQKI